SISFLPPHMPRSSIFPYTTLFRSRFRAFNVRLLGETSIGVNTVPSGHAAEALAAALLVSTAPVPVAAAFWVAAVAVTAGAVLGRDRKSTRLNSSHVKISYAVFCLK